MKVSRSSFQPGGVVFHRPFGDSLDRRVNGSLDDEAPVSNGMFFQNSG